MNIIIKRDGRIDAYHRPKIEEAMKKAFCSVEEKATSLELQKMAVQVEEQIDFSKEVSVETVQDIVEKVLMKNGFLECAKSYILYREERNRLRKHRELLSKRLIDQNLDEILKISQKDYKELDIRRLYQKYCSFEKEGMTEDEQGEILLKAAVELTSKEEPNWEMIAGRILYNNFRKSLTKYEEGHNLENFYTKLEYLVDEGLYGHYILESYTKDEIMEAHSYIDEKRNNLFTFAGLDLLLNRYVIRDRRKTLLESPQEMFLGVALHLAMKEPHNRLEWVKKFYDMLSLQKVTMATPTFSNARKPYHQLSSCFIDTVPDSLDGIYHSIENFARVSKLGGGMGMYLGKVRANGGSIRGFEGVAGGVIRWIKVINDTAVAVDQLGMRQGAVAVYLDVWHKDMPEFLQVRTNNGDDRMKAHDIFPAISYPDMFWKMAEESLDQPWYLMCPHDIWTIKGYHLEDYYGKEWEEKYWDCVRDSRISKREILLKDMVRLILKSAVETGTPFAFYRDAVNIANPNKHQGIIYCSNLCTEIAQNMSEGELISEEVILEDGLEVVVTKRIAPDFVVCNLASLCLGNIDVTSESEIREIVEVAVRALDNVIDLNYYPLPYAKITSQKMRSIGLGISGYHHMLAKNKIRWESKEHLKFVDKVFEDINYAAIKASSDLARERGSYQAFKGSEWETGIYFDRRNYDSTRWNKLRKEVKGGMRNSYLLAVAPTSSTSILIGTTAGLDPVMQKFFLEEKKGTILPRVAPELGIDTYWYYKNAHTIDQNWTVEAAGVRQRHIDQAQSFNLYITNDYTLRQLMNLYIKAAKVGVKTIYYVRSKSLEVEDCDSCSS